MHRDTTSPTTDRRLHAPSAWAAPASVLLGLLVAAPASAQEAEPLDCLIEPNRIIEVGSAAVGVLEDVRVDIGDRVASGEVLATLESGVEAATVELARLRASIDTMVEARRVTHDLRRATRQRTTRLHETNAVAEQARDEADHDARIAALNVRQAEQERRLAALELLRAEHALARRTVRSPVDGVVMLRHRSPGERVEDHPIVQIAELDPLRVNVLLPVARDGAVRAGRRARVVPEHGDEAVVARVLAVDPVVDAASGTFGVHLEVPNPDYALSGGLRCSLTFLPPEAEPVAATRDGDAATPSEPVQPTALVTAPPRACRALGPLRDEALAEALGEALVAEGVTVRVHRRRSDELIGYLAVVDASGMRGGTTAAVAALARHGVEDRQVLSSHEELVSVGFYKGERGAGARAAAIEALGLPARVIPRVRERTAYIVEADVPAAGHPEGRLRRMLGATAPQDLSIAPCDPLVTARR